MPSIWSTRVEGCTQCADISEVRNALSILVAPDQTFEVRSLPSGKHRQFSGIELDAAVAFIGECSDSWGVYWTLNPLRPGLVKAATNKDVISRRWLLIDIDPVRPDTKSSSTDAEKEAASQVLNAVIDFVGERGWPAPVLIDSGNGYHLLYRIDLPNDVLTRQAIKDVLYELDRRFSGPGASVDKAMHNSARISKLPGTWARKGPSTPERPHRLAKILYKPDEVEVVTLEQLKAIVKPDSESSSWLDAWKLRTTGEGLGKYVEAAVERECCRIMAAIPGGAEGRNNTLNRAAFSLATMAAWPEMDATNVRARLKRAAEACGLESYEIGPTIESGWVAGAASPRVRPEPATKKPAPSVSPQKTGKSLVIRASMVEPRKVDWLWTNRVAIGFITLFAGRTGVGKSFVACDMVSRLTTGRPLADETVTTRTPMSVLMISEDPYEYVLAPRLKEMEADLDRVSFLTWEAMAGYSLADVEMLDTAYQQSGSPALIVVDPPTNFLGATDEHKNAEVRAVLMGLVGWLNMRSVACILITHINKQVGKGIEAVDRIMGSVAWASTSRVALAFSPDPNTPDQCLFSGVKNNLGAKAETLAYEIAKTETLAKVEWKGVVDITANDAMNGVTKLTRGQTAVEFLEERFREKREWRSNDILDTAREHGISRNAIMDTPEVKALPIRKKQIFSADGSRHWVWIAGNGWPDSPEIVRDSGILGFCEHKPLQDNTHNRVLIGESNGTLSQDPRIPESQNPSVCEETGSDSESVKRATRALLGILMAGPIPRDQILSGAMERGLSIDALDGAAEALGVERRTEGGVETWKLP